MLDQLPPECLQLILSHLPSATAIVNVALVNRQLHDKISANNYGSFQGFVQRSFAPIKTSNSWRETAMEMTSSSRAWDRRAIIAREPYPTGFESAQRSQQGRSKFGFVPAIDSYRNIPWSHEKEVLAYSAGGKVILRNMNAGVVSWKTLRFPGDHEATNDILELKLLRPGQRETGGSEQLVLGKATGQITLVETVDGRNEYTVKARFATSDLDNPRIAVSPGREPMLAASDHNLIKCFPVSEASGRVDSKIRIEVNFQDSIARRQRSIRFLNERKLALAPQNLEGRQSAPIIVYDIDGERQSTAQDAGIASLMPSDLPTRTRHSANILCPIDRGSNHDDQVFLSGWTDGVVRLHDLRTGRGHESSFTDKVDDGQILSLVPAGHQSFLAGSHQNGCLKRFDMRSHGEKTYSYLDARAPVHASTRRPGATTLVRQPQRDINIFLAFRVPHRHIGWKPLNWSEAQHNLNRYSGSVYSLSSPSPSTVFAGIEDHVVQLDFTATDDIRRSLLHVPELRKDEDSGPVLNISCYERPREGYEATDAAILRHQRGLEESPSQGQAGGEDDGWDERWYVKSSLWERKGRSRRSR